MIGCLSVIHLSQSCLTATHTHTQKHTHTSAVAIVTEPLFLFLYNFVFGSMKCFVAFSAFYALTMTWATRDAALSCANSMETVETEENALIQKQLGEESLGYIGS